MAIQDVETITIFDFTKTSDLSNWYVVNDGVMGGRSLGHLNLNDDGHAVFTGRVSLDNNGGFTSIRHQFPRQSFDNISYILLRLKGDGKSYQVRIKARKEEFYSYTTQILTSGDWETIKIPLDSLSPVFRGRQLNLPNFSYKHLEEIGILIGNKKAESFKLVIDSIELSQ